ncbi:MAG: hypothetical protein QOI12_1723 [Alphaproteobacteria bacterium]|jgi:hypothetical protein|nr:hypothetical protein [Alphaproteobacteria bacterium]
MRDSRRVLASVRDDAPVVPALAPGAKAWTPVYIVASPRPQIGKTFLARLVTDFLQLDGGTVEAFDLNPDATALADFRPGLTTRSTLDGTEAQMALFDRLIAPDGIAKVVDLGHSSFERFFTLVEEIVFVDEARRRALELVILFPADAHPASIKSYGKLLQRFPHTILVPVFNEAILKGRKLREQYPFGRAAAVPLQIPILAPVLRSHADRSTATFADFHGRLPMEIPIGHAFELRSWTKRAFLEFRELELRMLLEKLRASLK